MLRSVGVLADLLQDLEAVHPRHQDVERHRVEVVEAQKLDRLDAAMGDRDAHIERRQLPGDQLGDLGLVVDDEHVAAADRIERRGDLDAGDRRR